MLNLSGLDIAPLPSGRPALHSRAVPLAPRDGFAMLSGSADGRQTLEEIFSHIEHDGNVQNFILGRPDFSPIWLRHEDSLAGQKGVWELMRLSPDLFVACSNVTYSSPATFPVAGEGLIEFHFRLSGKLSLSDAGSVGHALEVDRGSLLIWRQPEGRNITGHLDAEDREASVTIYLRPSVLENYFGRSERMIPDMLREKLLGDPASLFALRLNLIPKLTQLVQDLSTSSLQGALRLVQAEALVMLILCEIMTMLETPPQEAASCCRLTDADVRCLRQVHKILRERHAPPPTIEELAREVGLGTTKLKNGFKSLFGTTISQFANDLRMQRALELLRKPDIAISQVSHLLGYEYQNSFTAAFRRHFAILPKDYRRDPWLVSISPASGLHQ